MLLSNLSVEDKMAYARQILKKKMPYLSSAILSLVPKEVKGLGTFAVTEHMLLLYDPDKVKEWDLDELVFTMAHEVGHVLRNHSGRAKRMGINPRGENASLFNIAGDICINEDLKHAGLAPYQTDPTYEKYNLETNQTVEEVYQYLKENKDKIPKSGCKSPCCGSGAGHKHEQEGENGDDPGKRTKAEVNRVRKQTADAIRQMASKKGVGSVPGGWLKWAEMELEPPVIPWAEQFARLFRKAYEWKAGATDYKFRGVSRRQAGVGYGPGKPILPKLMAPVPEVHVVVDTSGSMGPEETQQAIMEIRGIIKAAGAQLSFMAVDAEVQAVGKITRWQDIKKLLKGGGGTNFHPIFDHYLKAKVKPEIIVFLTDGGGPAPAKNPLPGTDVICVLCGTWTHEPVDWWKYIYVDPKKRGQNSNPEEERNEY